MIKNLLTAAMLAVSVGGISVGLSASAMAAETAAGVSKAIADVKRTLAEAIQIAAAGTDKNALIAKIAEAKQYYKEITGDQYGARLQRLSSALSKARGMAQRSDMVGAEEELKKAQEIINTF